MHQRTRRPLTRIVATVGPASEGEADLARLIEAGVGTFRLNFSHGNQSHHAKVFDRIRTVARQLDAPVTILQDLQGPKLRIGDMVGGGPSTVKDGDRLEICTVPVDGTAQRISTSYADLGKDLHPGDQVLIDDGLIELRVESIERDTDVGDIVHTIVIHGGALKPQKGLNLPGTHVSQPALTPKDLDDLAFGVELGVDMVALSFVRAAQDVIDAKARIAGLGGQQPLISKIEKPQAVRNLEAIVRESDGLMVARGDLGVELSPDQVPIIQKRLIRLANTYGKPVITATQMLESMIQNARPTRAEASDIANAILDGTDAVMLSGETAVGAWPVQSVETMARIARTIEADASWRLAMRTMNGTIADQPTGDEATAIARAATAIAIDLGAKAIAVLTNSGGTARRVSQQRPGVPILAFADRAEVAAALSLYHGVEPVYLALAATMEELVRQVASGTRERGYAGSGDLIVIVGSVPRDGDTRAIVLEAHRLS
ncbi:MAG TPA: pyruvate kinase [Thermomicrobiales bacterium]|nr:pyruvate kinase [Thermomicrobiales bacterium]